MNILLLGSGGREHAFAKAISESAKCSGLFIAPGNSGTALHGRNVNLAINDFAQVRAFVLEQNISMVVVGPEDPLVNGIVDFFKSDEQLSTIPVIGPSAKGAKLEGSKSFSKDFMHRHNIPTAAYKSFNKNELDAASRFIDTLKAPYVLKADGLAAGKGVLILDEPGKAKEELSLMLGSGKFGSAGDTVVIEEFLDGIEVSVFVLTDGKNYKILPEAKDYKRIGEGDTGLNTGGMGAVSPVPFADAEFMSKVEERIIKPTVSGLSQDNIDYKGFIFIGLMNVNGDPYVIEYNCRMGDPETEVVIPRIKTDLVEIFLAVADEKLSEINLETDPRTAVTVMMVSGGYPGDYKKGHVIYGLENVKGAFAYHAGTSVNDKNEIITNGGRVLAFTAFGNTIEDARKKSYTAAENVSFDKHYYRKDIGLDLISISQPH